MKPCRVQSDAKGIDSHSIKDACVISCPGIVMYAKHPIMYEQIGAKVQLFAKQAAQMRQLDAIVQLFFRSIGKTSVIGRIRCSLATNSDLGSIRDQIVAL